MNNILNIFEKMNDIAEHIKTIDAGEANDTLLFEKNIFLKQSIINVRRNISSLLIPINNYEKIKDSTESKNKRLISEHKFMTVLEKSFLVYEEMILYTKDISNPKLMELYFNTLYVATKETLTLFISDLKNIGFYSVNFDYLHDEMESYSKEQIIGLINYNGGVLEYYNEVGVGGGNPEFTALLPKEVNEKDFLKLVYRD